MQLVTRSTLGALVLALALLGAALVAFASAGPEPPCGGETPVPPLPAVGQAPNVQLWHMSALRADWQPPACTGWRGLRFDQMVGLAGRLPASLGAADLVQRLGAISTWTGIRYWSVTRGRCRELIADAYALAGPEASERRPDFTPDEMVAGRDLYFFEDDSGPGGGAVYRMRLREIDADRIVVETENVTAIKVFVVPLFDPGALRAFYVAERDQAGGWAYYSLSGATTGASRLALGHDDSYVNRALALYAHLADLDPCTLATARAASG